MSPVAPAGNGSEQTQSVSFTDDLGRTVTAEPPRRVAALIGSFADLWQLAGGADTLVAAADDAWTSFDLNLDEDVVDLGGVKQINLEQLAAAQGIGFHDLIFTPFYQVDGGLDVAQQNLALGGQLHPFRASDEQVLV